MKAKDIKVGETYVFKGRTWHPAEQVTVLETGVTQEVPHPTKRFGGTITKTGLVKIKVKGERKPQFVETRTIIEPWADHVEREEWRANANREAIEAMKQARSKIESLLPERFFDNGDRPDAEYDEEPGVLSYKFEADVYPDGSYSTEDRLSIFDLAELLEAAYEQGKREGS